MDQTNCVALTVWFNQIWTVFAKLDSINMAYRDEDGIPKKWKANIFGSLLWRQHTDGMKSKYYGIFFMKILDFYIIILWTNLFFIFGLKFCLHPKMPSYSRPRRQLRNKCSHLIASHCTHNTFMISIWHILKIGVWRNRRV